MSHYTVLVIGSDPETLLAPYNEDLEVPQYVRATKAQLIAKSRADVERYRTTYYADYLADPAAYEAKCRNVKHIEYIRDEFPKRLEWTDEEHYADAISWLAPDDLDAEGGELSTRNPLSKWDWWTVGGRWRGSIPLLTGQDVDQALKRQIDLARWKRVAVADGRVALTFALLDSEGWIERGEMGWWGVVHDEQDEESWGKQFWARVDAAAPDDLFTVVDCHI